MKVIRSTSIQDAYRILINDLKTSEIVGNTKEINNCCLIVENPSISNFYLPYRDTSKKYLEEELKWYYSADNSCKTIGKFAKMWLRLSDDGETNNSAYGYILFKKYGFNQLEQIIELLRKDKDSRRAVLNISDPAIDRINTKDMQCTIAIQFLIRHGKLEETVYMRSNDVMFGLPYDYFFFVSLGKYVAEKLNIELALYTHHATSMHMYLKDEHKFVEQETVELINIDVKRLMEEYYEK